jgi:hypothetical protein
MRYFKVLPKVVYTNPKGYSLALTNISVRAKMIPKVLDNPLLYYKYSIKDDDTPEIIAHKYYGDSYYYWAILIVNEMQHPIWSWPMPTNVFNDFIENKYGQQKNDIYFYEKIITKTNLYTEEVTEERIKINQEEYNSIVLSEIDVEIGDDYLNIITDKREVSYYVYEDELNESKRNIKLLNKSYVDEFESELKRLMN